MADSSCRRDAIILSHGDLTQERLERIFRGHFESSNVRLVSRGNLDELTGVNDNLNSDINKVQLIFDVDGSQRVVNAVIKVPLQDSFHGCVSKHMHMFKRESFWYTRGQPELSSIFPVLRSFTATCYVACSNYDEALFRPKGFCERHCCLLCWCPCKPKERGLIMLEDVSLKEGERYFSPDKGLVLSVKQVETALTALAHFHGAWYCFLNNNIEESVAKTLSFTPDEVKSAFSSSLPMTLIKMPFMQTMKSIEVLLRNRGAPDAFVNRFYSARFALFNDLKKYATKLHADGSRLKTIIHGDFWTNNMMFSEDQSKVMFLDFQNLRLGSPYYDIGYFLYIGTDAMFRKQHLDHLLKVYFNVLKTYIGDEELNDGKGRFDFEDFKKEFEDRRSLYFFGGIALVPNMLSPNKVELGSLRDAIGAQRKRHTEIAGEDREDDHELIKEIRRRLVAMAYELDDQKLI